MYDEGPVLTLILCYLLQLQGYIWHVSVITCNTPLLHIIRPMKDYFDLMIKASKVFSNPYLQAVGPLDVG